MSRILIVGAGWAGLSCALALTKAGHQITLIEAAPQAGGRARAIRVKDYVLDNGQHICLGAYHTLRQILRDLQLQEQALFQIRNLELITYGARTMHLKRPTLSGILTAQGLPWSAKYQLGKFFYQARRNQFSLTEDCSVLTLLKNYQQSDFIVRHLWEPLVLAAMTTPIDQASARVFLRVLNLSFGTAAENSNWYLPATDLSAILPTHIVDYLAKNNAELVYGQSIKQLILLENKCIGVSSNKQQWQADHVVLAIPPWQVLPLFDPHRQLHSDQQVLSKFSYEPITTIYFGFPRAVNLAYPILATTDTTCHWVFDRAFAKQPEIISTVISGSGPHQELSQEELATKVWHDLQRMFSHLPVPNWQRVIQEKRAAFSCNVTIQSQRPKSATNVENLWLAGDYLQTGLPATLEGALLSGGETAAAIIRAS